MFVYMVRFYNIKVILCKILSTVFLFNIISSKMNDLTISSKISSILCNAQKVRITTGTFNFGQSILDW